MVFGKAEERKILFFVVLLIFIGLFFYFNYYALNQQYIFSNPQEQIIGTNFGKLIADDIIKYKRYVYSFMEGSRPSFYPLWGYPLLTLIGVKLGNYRLFISVFQAILALHGIWIFYKLFDIKERLYHILLFIPFFGILSVKWPDGIVCYLMLLTLFFISEYLRQKGWRNLLYTGVVLGIMANFRPDYFYLPLFFLFFLPFLNKNLKISYKLLSTSIILVFLIQIVFLLPWVIRSIRFDGKIRLSAANGGGTLYTSLGEWPNNPWGLIGDDDDAWKFAQTHDKYGNIVEKQMVDLSANNANLTQGSDIAAAYKLYGHTYRVNFYPFGSEGDDLLRREAIRLIKQHPGAFLKKIAHHFFMIFRDGLYTNEFFNFNISTERQKRIVLEFKHLTAKEKLAYLLSSPVKTQRLRILIWYAINTAFRILFPFLLIYFLIHLFNLRIKRKPIFYILVPFIIYKILLTSLIQYAPRHFNITYLLLLGYFLITQNFSKKQIQ